MTPPDAPLLFSSLALQRVRAAYAQLGLPAPALLRQLPAQGWLPLTDPLAFLRDAGGEPLPAAARFQLGSQLIDDWYHEAAGFTRCPGALDVLQHHVRAGSYAQMARGSAAGSFALLQLDETAGLAHVHSSTPFCRDWERGLIQGALDAPADLLYSDVRWDAASSRFELRFITDTNRTSVHWALGEPEAERVWRLRERVRRLEQRNAWLEARPADARPTRQSASADWLDPLTGAASEAHLLERLRQAGQEALPPRLCLLAYGLEGGAAPEALRQLGAAGLRLSRRGDLLARFGETDLALLLHEIDADAARRVALRLADSLAAPLRARLRASVLSWQGGDPSSLLARARARLQLSARSAAS